MVHVLWSLLSLLSISTLVGQSVDLRVMTYNIRYNNPNDGPNRWDERKANLCHQITFVDPDFIGTQEGLHDQIAYLGQELKAYEQIGVGRDDGKKAGEFCSIFYRKDKYKLLESGTFWLSPTPDVPSKGWDAALNRICTYGLFRFKNQRFWVFNAHFDHKGKRARQESAKVIWKKIESLNRNNYPVIVLGDLNDRPSDPPLLFLKRYLKDAYDHSKQTPFGPSGTFNGFKWGQEVNGRIDYILVSKKVKVEQHATLSDATDKKYPSDHFPVVADLIIEK